MLIISSKEFRDNQKSYFDRVDNGEQILVQRSKNKSYKIVPVTDNDIVIENPSPSKDTYFNIPQNVEKIKLSMQQAEQGNTISVKEEDLEKYLGLK
ncbi:MAG: prevent-host-death protein [Prevotellaceae bacterium]|jgi:PHD/YefM family antitoxin component YafN of YafNO toxin-antitoxin module|nr:prevent-host-death protein [Prevotellaceae bacterium]